LLATSTRPAALAKATLDNVAMRDPHAIVHTASFDVLQKMTPHFDWILFYKSANLQPGKVNVEQPEFLAEFDRQLVSTSLADWKIYLRWQLLNSSADNLSQSFVNARFDLVMVQLYHYPKANPLAAFAPESASLECPFGDRTSWQGDYSESKFLSPLAHEAMSTALAPFCEASCSANS